MDDTIIDKPHSQYIELTCFQWSVKYRKVIRGIGLISLVWTNGFHTFPIGFRIYNRPLAKLILSLFSAMLSLIL